MKRLVPGALLAEMTTVLNSYAVEYHHNMRHSGPAIECCAAGCSEAAAVLRAAAELDVSEPSAVFPAVVTDPGK